MSNSNANSAAVAGQRPTFTAILSAVAGKATPYELALLLVINVAGFHAPISIDGIARDSGMSRRKVSSTLRDMEAKGWIVRTHYYLPDGGRDCNGYEITVPIG